MRALLLKLREHKIHLSLVDNNLKLSFNGEKIDPVLLEEIKSNKAALLDYLKGQTQHAPETIGKAAPSESYPLTSTQYRLWILSQLENASVAYDIHNAVTIKGEIVPEAFTEALKKLINRYEILRTSFKLNTEGEVRQYVTPVEEISVNIKQIDCSGMEKENTVDHYFHEINKEPFNLEQAPLLRASILKTGENEHVFFLSIHHIISDGWSMHLFMSEFIYLYNALSNKQPILLPELNIQYKDYAVWSNEARNKEAFQLAEKYWLNQFSGEIPILNLPVYQTRPTVFSYKGNTIVHRFSASFLQKVKQFSVENNATLFMTLMAGINALIYRYTGQPEFIVGTPIAGREHPDTQNQLGLFLNTLAIKVLIGEQPSFSDVLQNSKKTLLEAYDHQNYPFDELVSKLNLKRDPARSPLFDVLIVLQNQNQLNPQTETPAEYSVRFEQFHYENGTAQYDLSFAFKETDSLLLELTYNTDCYNQEYINAFIGHFENLMEQVLVQPQAALGTIDYLSTGEKHTLLHELNNTQVDYSDQDTLVSLFEKQVAKTPDLPAVVYNDSVLTYSELNEKINRFSHYLQQKLAITPDDLVAVKLERSEWMVISIFAILKAGGAYVPVDPHFPAERAAYIISDSNCKGVIDANEIERFLQEELKWNIENPKTPISPTNLAYCIYTSGSTGNPKGCLLEHTSLINRLQWMQKAYPLTHKDVVLQKTVFTFDVSVWELTWNLIQGAGMYLLRSGEEKDPEAIVAAIEKNKVTVLHFVPSMFSLFLEYIERNRSAIDKTRTLQQVFTSGEALLADQVIRFRKLLPEVNLMNLYGPTEASIDVSYYACDSDQVPLNVPIGKPIDNTALLVLDKNNRLLPYGCIGEICIGGTGLARGYLNREDLTKEKFIAHPYQSNERLYRTGDLGRWNSDGQLEYLGRIDNQVKIRGFRIELGEIECALKALDYIENAVVLACEIEGMLSLAAYIIPTENPDILKLKADLAKVLPEYMIPGHYQVIESIPLSHNGKADLKQLRQLNTNWEKVQREYVAPKTVDQQHIATIWAQELNHEKVGITDDFFDLGGDSIRSIRIMSRINRELNVNFKMGDIYSHATIEQLLAIKSERTEQEIPTETREEITLLFEELSTELKNNEELETIFPMSDIELGMLYGSAMNANPGMYHDQFLLPIPVTRVDFSLFSQAVQLMVNKHEILRTSYDFEHYSVPVHCVHKQLVADLSLEDLSDKNKQEQLDWMSRFMQQERENNAFDFQSKSLWRMKVLRIAESEWCMLFQFHHAILDGWSLASLMTELNNTYRTLTRNESPISTKLAVTYKDYVFEQSCIKASGIYHAYWRETLAGYKKQAIFTDRAVSEKYHTFIDGQRYELLRKYHNETGISLKTIFFSAYVYTLSMLSYEQDLVVGIVENGRPLFEDGDKLLGCFLNTMPFRMVIGNTTFNDFTQQVHQRLTAQKQFSNISLPEIANHFSEEAPTENPFFDALFNYIDFHIYDELDTDEGQLKQEFSFDQLNFETTNTFLDLNVQPARDGIIVYWQQERALKGGITVEQLQEYFDQFLDNLVQHKNEPVTPTSLLSGAEIQKLLSEFNTEFRPKPEYGTVLDMILEQVNRHPENCAILANGNDVTYRELHEKSNQFAHYLHTKCTIEPNDLIGIKLQPDEWLIISILGVLKAGAAYLPIDVGYPQSRIAFIEQDSQCRLIIDDETVRQFKEEENAHSKQDLKPIATGDNLAYIIYTSGSTGTPKGVKISGEALLDYMQTIKEAFGYSENDRILQFTSISFDVSVEELFSALVSGAQLIIPEVAVTQNSQLLATFIQQNNITVLSTSPLLINELNNHSEMLKSVRLMIIGGDMVRGEYVTNLLNQSTLYNAYGPTESTISTTFGKITSLDKAGSLGKPIRNRNVFITDENGFLLPQGIVGEICISGKGLAKGYLNRPELTKEKFIANPFQTDSLLYKTGDLGKWNPDGTLEFVGRIDDQVKIRGFRIELGEIEQQLAGHEAIKEAVVLAVDSNDGTKELVAYFTSDQTPLVAELRAFLREKLPYYMIPESFIQVAKIPVTQNGKTDKKALLKMSGSIPALGIAYQAPDNDSEEKMAAIVRAVSGRITEQIGVNDNFFDLGINSLKLMKMLTLVNEGFGVEIKIVSFFDYPTIRELVGFIEGQPTASAMEVHEEIDIADSMDEMIDLM